ncbi:MAG: VCBS repeat-containing protein, partial [Deltaproteobacteria bacterium]|nr:VCBS repeat-containing protein [Deltaproteobacteria bacterium]
MRLTAATRLLPIILFAVVAALLVIAPSVRGLQQGPELAAPHHEPTGLVPHAIAVADFNGDGVPDVAVPAAAERKVTVLLSNGQGGFAANHSYAAGIGPSWVESGDWNGDGKLDLVTANTGGGSLTL